MPAIKSASVGSCVFTSVRSGAYAPDRKKTSLTINLNRFESNRSRAVLGPRRDSEVRTRKTAAMPAEAAFVAPCHSGGIADLLMDERAVRNNVTLRILPTVWGLRDQAGRPCFVHWRGQDGKSTKDLRREADHALVIGKNGLAAYECARHVTNSCLRAASILSGRTVSQPRLARRRPYLNLYFLDLFAHSRIAFRVPESDFGRAGWQFKCPDSDRVQWLFPSTWGGSARGIRQLLPSCPKMRQRS